MKREKENRTGNGWYAMPLMFLALLVFAFINKYMQYLTFNANDFDSGVDANLA